MSVPDTASKRALTPTMHPKAWEIRAGSGPVLATSIHAGHDIRPELLPWMSASGAERRREEDPLTDFWATLGDASVRVNRSRFEVDMNRSRQASIAFDPEQTWGLSVWKARPPKEYIDFSRSLHEAFYREIGRLLDSLVERWPALLVLDLHSYNHRRDTDDQPADHRHNPDIDLGFTTLDHRRFGKVAVALQQRLNGALVRGKPLDVRANVKYEGGGYFPEWIYRHYGDRVCTITLEVKKMFMDEHSGTADIAAIQQLRRAIATAVSAARQQLIAGR